MARRAIPLFLYAETPLHPGTGAHLGAVDLPVQRERHTGYPIVQGASLKGVFRALAGESGWPLDEVAAIFGPDTQSAHEYGGAVTFTDARILLFPVRAIGTVFAWATAPDVVARLRRDLVDADGMPPLPKVPELRDGALVPPGSELLAEADRTKGEGPIVLEEFSYQARAEAGVRALGEWLGRQLFPDSDVYAPWKRRLAADLVLLGGDAFREFTTTATEVVSRVRLSEKTKTVESGGLWTEEHVPSESAFHALVLAQQPRAPGAAASGWTADWVVERLRGLDGARVQIGGDETTGRGFCLVRLGGRTDGQTR